MVYIQHPIFQGHFYDPEKPQYISRISKDEIYDQIRDAIINGNFNGTVNLNIMYERQMIPVSDVISQTKRGISRDLYEMGIFKKAADDHNYYLDIDRLKNALPEEDAERILSSFVGHKTMSASYEILQ